MRFGIKPPRKLIPDFTSYRFAVLEVILRRISGRSRGQQDTIRLEQAHNRRLSAPDVLTRRECVRPIRS
jgi:hypothetical protein